MSNPTVSDLESRFGGDSSLAPGSTSDPAAPWNQAAPDEEEEEQDEEESGEIFLL
jgi:hypothetical protein